MDQDLDQIGIGRDLSVKEYRVLLALHSAGGEAQMSDLTDATGMSNHLVNHYLKQEGKLIDLGLAEHVKGDLTGGIPRGGYTYALTEKGRKVVSLAQEDYSLTPLEEGEVRRRLEELDERLSRIEERLDQVVADVASNTEATEGNHETIQKLGRAGKAAANRIRELEKHVGI